MMQQELTKRVGMGWHTEALASAHWATLDLEYADHHFLEGGTDNAKLRLTMATHRLGEIQNVHNSICRLDAILQIQVDKMPDGESDEEERTSLENELEALSLQLHKVRVLRNKIDRHLVEAAKRVLKTDKIGAMRWLCFPEY